MKFRDKREKLVEDIGFLQIIKVDKEYYNLLVEGVLGVGPWYADRQDLPGDIQYNFMNQLIKTKTIKRNIVSIYSSRDAGNSSLVKFGGYDEKGVDPTYDLVMLQTANKTTWSIKVK